ncbi:MAG: tautomerase family protein [Ndongobacter sp.]|nr:tautomerase family protein [Ndongobacter sp.]
MPTYTVYVQHDVLTEEQEQKIAEAITQAHSKTTGAPRYYVQVILTGNYGGRRFVGGLPSERQLWIHGDIRSGRTDEQRKELMLALMDGVSKAADIEQDDIWIDLNEIQPTSILKYKTVFPPAGKEKEWFQSLPKELRQKLDAEQ